VADQSINISIVKNCSHCQVSYLVLTKMKLN
jgi:hypothetical protein